MLSNLKIMAAGLITIAFLALPVYYWHAQQVRMDNLQCQDPASGELLVIILDVSDPYDPVDANRVAAEITEALARLPKGTRYVMIRPNEKDPYTPIEELNACALPALDTSATYLMSPNAIEAYKKSQAQAIEQARKKTDVVLHQGPSRTSPLIETLVAISKMHDFRSHGRATIYMYSDMEQNSPNSSVYKRHHTQQAPSKPMPFEPISLGGTKIYVKRIVRRTSLGLEEHQRIRDMWNGWFKSSNAEVIWEK
ncbi:hypothetical protein [Aquabacterium sp. CECT 9606]|uniref:hypothetical protein n=1 Tax=Aquabacterium sp. CECT 9606 TaxID=2845822 RepID=UPI001E37A16A|nr:hypothetical protein [Aquabacterium sp. CECT 9606]CAH0356174.1 hypothetical protein AQB9606_04598 [Aquabacterium sp. CECT 9606]